MKIVLAALALLAFSLPAWAGISKVQAAENLGQGSAATYTCALTSTTAGNLVVMWARLNAIRGVSSTADTNGNTWATAVNFSANSVSHHMVYSTLTTGGNTTITVTVSGGNTGGAWAQCAEFSSTTGWPATASVLDGTDTGNAASGTAWDVATGVTTAQAEELLVGAHDLSANRTITAGANMTLLVPDPTNSQVIHSVYRVTTSTGTYTVPVTGSSSAAWNSYMAAFKNNAAAQTVRPARRIFKY